MLATERNGGKHILRVTRDYDSDWNLAIVGAVGGVKGTAAGIEANLAAKVAAQSGFQCGRI
jgi:hypothetical protein